MLHSPWASNPEFYSISFKTNPEVKQLWATFTSTQSVWICCQLPDIIFSYFPLLCNVVDTYFPRSFTHYGDPSFSVLFQSLPPPASSSYSPPELMLKKKHLLDHKQKVVPCISTSFRPIFNLRRLGFLPVDFSQWKLKKKKENQNRVMSESYLFQTYLPNLLSC